MDELTKYRLEAGAEKTNHMIKNDKSLQAKKSEDYIKYQTGADVSSPQISVDKQGRINVDQRRSIRIDHKSVASDIVKIAYMVPGISSIARRIIGSRVVNPGITACGIGLSLGLTEVDVLRFEQDAINKIKIFLATDLNYKDAVEKASKDNVVSEAVARSLNLQGNKNSLLQ